MTPVHLCDHEEAKAERSMNAIISANIVQHSPLQYNFTDDGPFPNCIGLVSYKSKVCKTIRH